MEVLRQSVENHWSTTWTNGSTVTTADWTVQSILSRMPRMNSAAPNRKHSLTARGAQTRQRIVDATAKLIYDRGAEATSLDEVCEAGGVSKSQLYHYFEDKDALVREVITLQANRILAAQSSTIDELDSIDALRR